MSQTPYYLYLIQNYLFSVICQKWPKIAIFREGEGGAVTYDGERKPIFHPEKQEILPFSHFDCEYESDITNSISSSDLIFHNSYGVARILTFFRISTFFLNFNIFFGS